MTVERLSANYMLRGLNEGELTSLSAVAQDITLERGQVVADAGGHSSFVFFPLEGVLSLIGTTSSGDTVELAVVGREGIADLSTLFGARWLPFRVVAQVPGRALRLPSADVNAVVARCGELHQRLFDCTHRLVAQMAQSAVCNRFHTARQRLARWLLMTADRTDRPELPLTHEFIAVMVGGPRSAVTEAAAGLRQSGAIDYRRGLIVIRDRAALLASSCACYQRLEEESAGVDQEACA